MSRAIELAKQCGFSEWSGTDDVEFLRCIDDFYAAAQAAAVPEGCLKYAIEALAIPNNDAALREQNARLLEQMAEHLFYADDIKVVRRKAAELRSGKL